MLCYLPTPIVFQHERSYMKQKLERNTRQHYRDLVNWLTDIKLKVKEGTHGTFLRIKVNVTWIVPICVTVTLSQFRQLDKSGNKTSDFGKQSDGMNDMACGPNVKNPSFNNKVSLVCKINSKKIEWCILKHLDSWKGSQEILERLLGLMEKLAMCTALLDPNWKAWEFSMDVNCWHYSKVKRKGLFWCAILDWHWSPSTITWLAIASFPFCL